MAIYIWKAGEQWKVLLKENKKEAIDQKINSLGNVFQFVMLLIHLIIRVAFFQWIYNNNSVEFQIIIQLIKVNCWSL